MCISNLSLRDVVQMHVETDKRQLGSFIISSCLKDLWLEL